MYSFLVHSYAGIKNRDEGKNGQESNNEIEEALLKSLIVRLDWSLDEIGSCKETTLAQVRNPQLDV